MKAAMIRNGGGAAGAAALLLAIAAAACTDTAPVGPGVASELHLVPDSATLPAGTTVRLQPVFIGGEPEALAFSAADPTIASVDSTGMVRARWPGTTVISAASLARPALKGGARIVVRGPALRITPDPVEVPSGWGGRTIAVETVGLPASRFFFRTSDTLLARVDSTGFVCGLRAGTAWVEARAAADTTVRNRATISVVNLPPPPVPPPWYFSFTDTSGVAIPSNVLSGTVLVHARWENWQCDPPAQVTAALQVDGGDWLDSSPHHAWVRDSVVLRLNTSATDSLGRPRFVNGSHVVGIRLVRESDHTPIAGIGINAVFSNPIQR